MQFLRSAAVSTLQCACRRDSQGDPEGRETLSVTMVTGSGSQDMRATDADVDKPQWL